MTIWTEFPDGQQRSQLHDRLLLTVGAATVWPEDIPLEDRLCLVTCAAIFSYERFKTFEDFSTELYQWEANGVCWAMRCVSGHEAGTLDFVWAVNQLPRLAKYIQNLPIINFRPRVEAIGEHA
jgi:hypothetical protein